MNALRRQFEGKTQVVDAQERPAADDGVFIMVRKFLERGCRLLDSEDYAGWLASCSGDIHYAIQAYSPEIRRDVIWLDKDRDGLRLLFEQLPMHERYKGVFRRMLGWTEAMVGDDPQTVMTDSGLCVYHTDIHGASVLYCTGRYRDEIRIENGQPVLRARTVLMDTRRLPFGSHVPI